MENLKETVDIVVNSRYPEMNREGRELLAQVLIRKELEKGELVSILDNYIKSKFEISLWFRSLKVMPSRCLKFKDFLVKRTLEIKDLIHYS